ncbi:acyl-CoA N-acyltransferase [Cyathus striatus]|nr:acyl-CoA N-acyltransferase [Cyathus striatus]
MYNEMEYPQLHPLQVNPTSGEYFLPLKDHPNIIFTPPRWSDAPYLSTIMNDDRVHPWLESPPYPYHQEHGEEWLKIIIPRCDAALQTLKDAKPESNLLLVEHCPVRYLREVQEDGTDIFIGDVDISRCDSGELMGTYTINWDEKERCEGENSNRPLGDPAITWSVGDFLAPGHHGKGIMTDALGTLINSWAIPRMGVRRILATAMINNHGSVKVFLKNGFKLTRTIPEHKLMKGRMTGSYVLEWEAT